MKKLIAISVVFALVAGVSFAVDLGGTVIGTVNVIEANSGGDVKGSASMNRIRLEGGGEVADGKFGGWLRFEAPSWGVDLTELAKIEDIDENLDLGKVISWSDGIAGLAWWKPIDQLKLGIGGNPDGIWGKEGNASWMFYQAASDTGVVSPSNAWGGDYAVWPNRMRAAFYGGFGDRRLFIEITPVDIVSINIGVPFFRGGDIGDIFKSTDAQIALNLSFGSFAFTYVGNSDIKASNMFAYFCLTAVDNLQIDFGLGAQFNNGQPLSLGLAVKYGQDTWGIKFRSLFNIPLDQDMAFGLLFDVLPYFVVNENFRVFVSGGVNFGNVKELKDGVTTWHVNPYIEVGEEWGAKFLAGIKVFQRVNDGAALVNFAIPIALIVSF